MGLLDFADYSLRLKPRLREAIQKLEQISERRSIIWNRDGTSALPSFWENHGVFPKAVGRSPTFRYIAENTRISG